MIAKCKKDILPVLKATNTFKNNCKQLEDDFEALTKLVASKKDKTQALVKEVKKIKKEIKEVEKEVEQFKESKVALEAEIKAEAEVFESVE